MPTQPYAQDPELADRIPDEVGGRPVEIQTVCATVADVAGGLPTSSDMLDAVGVGREDVTIAFGLQPEAGSAGITAWRYHGADEATVREAWLGLLEEAEIPVEQRTIAGKDVHVAVFHAYYVAGDTLYAVLGEDELLEEAVAALP